jgi:sugar phosphate isomerase/epimerase
MLRLSAFADEISPKLDEQIRVCRACGVTHIELRSVDQVNVLDLTPPMRKTIKSQLAASGIGVVGIGSPIGKVKITDPWEPHFERFKIAVEAAAFFEAPFVRLFSYYPPDERTDIRAYREEVLRRMAAKVEFIRDSELVLVHENEKGIYGEKCRECVDLMQTVNSPRLRTAFDFANFVQAGQRPSQNWPALKSYTAHIHVKDALLEGGKVVPAGEGNGDIEPILKDAYAGGYRGFLSLEPHLAAQGQFSGFSGPQLFTKAADALKALCARAEIPLALGTP